MPEMFRPGCTRPRIPRTGGRPAGPGAVLLWYGAPFERRVWGSLLLFIVVSALAGYLTIIRYNHKLKKSQQ